MSAEDAAAPSGARARVRARRGRRGGARDRQPPRDRQRDRLRHGRDDRQGLADRGRRRLARPRIRGRRVAVDRQPADARRGRAAPHPDRSTSPRWVPAAARSPGSTRQAASRSARAAQEPRPGPACYGRGGIEPTVTDANVFLGYIPAGPVASGDLSISVEAAESAVARIATPLELSLTDAAEGIHAIANARMTRALRSVSSEKGRDPREFALIAYGGSGPVHAAGARGGARLHDRARPRARRPLLLARPAVRAARVPRRRSVPPRRAHRLARPLERRFEELSHADRAARFAGSRPNGSRRPSCATAGRAGRSRSSFPPARSTRARGRG